MLRSIAASMFSYLFETMKSFISILRAWDGGPSNMAITRTSLFILGYGRGRLPTARRRAGDRLK